MTKLRRKYVIEPLTDDAAADLANLVRGSDAFIVTATDAEATGFAAGQYANGNGQHLLPFPVEPVPEVKYHDIHAFNGA